MKKASLLVLLFVLLLVVFIPVTAQRNRTPEAPPLRPTRTPEFVATIQAQPTQRDFTDIRATALISMFPLPNTTPQVSNLRSLIETLREFGEAEYDDGDLVVSLLITESQLETLLGATNGSVTFNSGSITVILEEVEINEQLSGTLTLTIVPSAVDGALVVEVTDATVNGRALPDAVIQQLEAQFAALIDSLLTGELENVDYTLDSINVTDDALAITATVTIP